MNRVFMVLKLCFSPQADENHLQVLFAMELILRVGAFGFGDSKQTSWGFIFELLRYYRV